MAGWIKIHRDIQKHWIAQDMQKFGWWIDMLLLASYEDNEAFLGNKVTEVKRGQFIASLRFLAERWKVSKDKVNAFLKILVEHGMIDRVSDKNTTLITICKYESYQDISDTFETPLRHLQDTSKTPSRQTKEIQEVQEIYNNNSNAHTREERVVWEEAKESSLKEAFKANGQMMALARNYGLKSQEIAVYLERYCNERQVINFGHQDISHFGKGFKKYVDEEVKKPKVVEKTKQKVIEGKEIFNLYK